MRVFIVSSGRAKSIAQQIQYHLTQQLKDINGFECDIWCSDTFEPGDYTLDKLMETCTRSDFAVILLTKDDCTWKKTTELSVPRDNCLLELGLFLGGLMFQKSRCIVLSSVQKGALPSDIEGITVEQFEEPTDLESASVDTLANTVKKTIPVIANAIKAYGPLLRLELSQQTLLKLERLDLYKVDLYRGRLRPQSTVTVKAAQPLEVSNDVDFADQVQRNLEGFVNYRYFFQYNLWGLGAIASLVQVLASAGIPERHPLKRREKMTESEDQVRKNLDNMKQRITIDLFSKMAPMEFCIYNAENPAYAECYLRLMNRNFIKYCEGAPAHDIAIDLMQVYPTPPDQRPIFADSLDKLCPDLRNRLRRLLQDLFDPSFKAKVEEVCFGG